MTQRISHAKPRRTPTRRLTALGLLLAASPLLAHHEWPVDRSQRITIAGTVSGFRWANPHVTIALDVHANGTVATWTIGGSSPQYMAACGWDKKALKPGDVITVIGYRFKDGSTNAQAQTIVMPDGRKMYYGAPPSRTTECAPRDQ